jgi:quercetin dioxygenase-like cupin family protein
VADARWPPGIVELAEESWVEAAPGIFERAGTMNGVRWAVVRYAPGAERDEWCTDGHRGFVVAGHISYELADGSRLAVPTGAGFWLPPGGGHRGVNGDAETTLFLVDVPDESAVTGV